MTIQEKNFQPFVDFATKQKFPNSVTADANGNSKIEITHGTSKCAVTVYHTGKMNVQGANSKLKEALEALKKQIQEDVRVPEILPFEIESFPDQIKERIPHVDPVILHFLQEAIVCFKHKCLLGSAFLLGAASEKSIHVLIETFGEAIEDDTHKQNYKGKTGRKSAISKSFEEFETRFGGCKNKPNPTTAVQDFQQNIKHLFHFYRVCRNESGHPEYVPELNEGALLANMGQFVKYIESVYFLIDFYKANKVTL